MPTLTPLLVHSLATALLIGVIAFHAVRDSRRISHVRKQAASISVKTRKV